MKDWLSPSALLNQIRRRLNKLATGLHPRLAASAQPSHAEIGVALAILALLSSFLWTRRVDRLLRRVHAPIHRYIASAHSSDRAILPAPVGNKLERWLWATYQPADFPAMLFLAASLVISIPLSTSAVHALLATETLDHESLTISTEPIAAFAIAIFSALQAIIVFAVQLGSQSETRAVPVSTLLTRKHHVFEILSLCGGTAIGSLSLVQLDFPLPLLMDTRHEILFDIHANLVLTVCAAISAILSTRMLVNVVKDIGSNDIKSVGDALQVIYAELGRRNRMLLASGNDAVTIMSTEPFSFHPFLWRVPTEHSLSIAVHRRGRVIDIDHWSFRALRQLVTAVPSIESVAFVRSIGDGVNHEGIAFVQPRMLAGSESPEKIPKAIGILISWLVRRAFIIERGTHEL